MKKNFIVSLPALILLLSVIAVSCGEQSKPIPGNGHREAVTDSSVQLLARPVNERVMASMPAIAPQGGTRIVSAVLNGLVKYDTRRQTSLSSRVSGRIERLLIKYNYQPVRKGQLIMELYSPDLAAAQRELLYVAKQNPALLPGARQRLLLLGMGSTQIDQVLSSGNVLYRIPLYSNCDGYIVDPAAVAGSGAAAVALAGTAAQPGDGMGGMGASPAATAPSPVAATTPVLIREGQYVNAGQTLFTLYQATDLIAAFALPPELAPFVQSGQKLLFYPAGNKPAIEVGRLGLIEPVYRNGQDFLMARVYLGKNHLQVGQLMTGVVPVVYRGGWWLPKKAVSTLGTQSVVFKKEGATYVPKAVRVGVEADGYVLVHSAIGNWQIAAHAAYLIDSESFIKASSTTNQ